MHIKVNDDLWIHANPSRLKYLGMQWFNKDFLCNNLIKPRVCSLSNIWSSNLLWTHYAAGHSGIAIGVVLPTPDDSIKKLIMKYDNEVPKFLQQHTLTREDVLNALTHKSKEWEIEKEVRFVTFDTERAYIENIEVKEIYFGLRTSKDDIRLIFSILKNDDVKFFKTCLKPGSYILNKSDIPWLRSES